MDDQNFRGGLPPRFDRGNRASNPGGPNRTQNIRRDDYRGRGAAAGGGMPNRDGPQREPLISQAPQTQAPHNFAALEQRFNQGFNNNRGFYQSPNMHRGRGYHNYNNAGGGQYNNNGVGNGPTGRNNHLGWRDNYNQQHVYHGGGRDADYNQSRYHNQQSYNNNDQEQKMMMEYNPEVLSCLQYEGVFLRSLQARKKKLSFKDSAFYCRLCDYHCRDIEHCKEHITGPRHGKVANVRAFEAFLKILPAPTPAMFNALTNTLVNLAQEQRLTPQEREQRINAAEFIIMKIKEKVCDCELELSGSTYTGLALKFSDVNVNVFVEDKRKHRHVLLAIKEVVESIPECKNVACDFKSAMPSVSFTASEYGGCLVVITLGQITVRSMARLIAAYVKIDDRFMYLATAFRYWSQLCGINDQKNGSLPSIAYTVMVVHYLQHLDPPVLPIMAMLHKNSAPESFPAPEDIDASAFKSRNTMSIGELWYDMLHFYAYKFKFSSYNINMVQHHANERNDKTYVRKLSIEDPFNPKKNLARSVSNVAIIDYILDGLLKVLCRYFSVPQLPFGQLYMTLWQNKEIIQEKKTRNFNLNRITKKGIKPEEQVSNEEENDGQLDSELDLSVQRIFRLQKSGEESVEEYLKESSKVTNVSQISKHFDALTQSEAKRITSMIEEEDFCFKFSKEIFTEGRSLPVYCASCQQEGHLKDDCPYNKLPDLHDISNVSTEVTNLLTTLLDMLKTQMMPSEAEMNNRNNVVQKLTQVIAKNPKYKNAKLELFGSSANGFGFANSDLDVCITFADNERFDQHFLVQNLCSVLRQEKQSFRDVTAIPTAKVPIVKFTSIEYKLEGDLSPFNTLALHNTKLLRTYSNIDPRVKTLGYGFKYFAKRCDIGDASRGSLSSYAYTLMLIHFLQQCNPPVVPVLQQLYEDEENPPEPVIVEGWNTWFFSDLDKLPSVWEGYHKNKSSVGELWVQMFRYYTEVFNFDECIITIRQKEPLYRLERFWNNQSIAIEDPFDLNHNLGGALSRKMNTFIRKAFINGRHLYGGLVPLPGNVDSAEFFFSPEQLTVGEPPNDRGCRRCRKIGHLAKSCPEARGSNDQPQQQKKKPKQQKAINSNDQEGSNGPNQSTEDNSQEGTPAREAQETAGQELSASTNSSTSYSDSTYKERVAGASVAAGKSDVKNVSALVNKDDDGAEHSGNDLNVLTLFSLANDNGGRVSVDVINNGSLQQSATNLEGSSEEIRGASLLGNFPEQNCVNNISKDGAVDSMSYASGVAKGPNLEVIEAGMRSLEVNERLESLKRDKQVVGSSDMPPGFSLEHAGRHIPLGPTDSLSTDYTNCVEVDSGSIEAISDGVLVNESNDSTIQYKEEAVEHASLPAQSNVPAIDSTTVPVIQSVSTPLIAAPPAYPTHYSQMYAAQTSTTSQYSTPPVHSKPFYHSSSSSSSYTHSATPPTAVYSPPVLYDAQQTSVIHPTMFTQQPHHVVNQQLLNSDNSSPVATHNQQQYMAAGAGTVTSAARLFAPQSVMGPPPGFFPVSANVGASDAVQQSNVYTNTGMVMAPVPAKPPGFNTGSGGTTSAGQNSSNVQQQMYAAAALPYIQQQQQFYVATSAATSQQTQQQQLYSTTAVAAGQQPLYGVMTSSGHVLQVQQQPAMVPVMQHQVMTPQQLAAVNLQQQQQQQQQQIAALQQHYYQQQQIRRSSPPVIMSTAQQQQVATAQLAAAAAGYPITAQQQQPPVVAPEQQLVFYSTDSSQAMYNIYHQS